MVITFTNFKKKKFSQGQEYPKSRALSLFVCKSLRTRVGNFKKSLPLGIAKWRGNYIYTRQLSLSPWAPVMLMLRLPHCRTDESRQRSDQCGGTQVFGESIKAQPSLGAVFCSDGGEEVCPSGLGCNLATDG